MRSFCHVLRLTLLLLLSHNSDSQSVNRLPKSIVVLLFAVVICVLRFTVRVRVRVRGQGMVFFLFFLSSISVCVQVLLMT